MASCPCPEAVEKETSEGAFEGTEELATEEGKDDAEEVRIVIFAPGWIGLLEGKALAEAEELRRERDGKGGQAGGG